MTVRLMHPNSSQEIEALPGSEWRYIAQGWRVIEPDAPKGNAPVKAWREFGRSKGLTDDEMKGMTRAELRAALG